MGCELVKSPTMTASHQEVVLVLEGVVHLSIGHRATFKPAVKDVIHTPQGPFATRAGDGDVVNEMPVQVTHLVEQQTRF